MSHKAFISYHHKDDMEVNKFIKEYGTSNVFINRIVGDEYGTAINSSNPEYTMRVIRENYLSDSSVTIVMIGSETYKRKYVDWEIASTIRNDSTNKRSGLVGIFLPGHNKFNTIIPKRLEDNIKSGYAKLYEYPLSYFQLGQIIEEAFSNRLIKSSLIDNSRKLKDYNEL
ncbi:MAG: TIR domain-containing protein [Bacilli bacterium]